MSTHKRRRRTHPARHAEPDTRRTAGPFAWDDWLNVNLPQGLRDDDLRVVGSDDDLPSDAQLAQLHQVFAQRLAELEATV